MLGKIPNKVAKLAAGLLAATAVMAVAAGTASATPSSGGASASASTVGAAMKFAPATKELYTFDWTQPTFYGPVHCTGKHLTNEKKGYPGTAGPGGTGGKDIEKCKSTTGKPLLGMAPGEHKVGPPIEGEGLWGSDWDGNAITTTNFEYTVNPKGTAFKLIAIYPFP